MQFLVLLIFISFLSNTSYAQTGHSYAVFTLNQDLPKLSKSKARMLFRGRVKSLQGTRIELSDWPSDHKIRNEFYQKLLGKDKAQMNAHWASLSFSGKARPPKEIKQDSMEVLLLWLEANQNRIGYAPVDALPKHANVLYVVQGEGL
ncbi:hypothetical protein HII17_18560 [Thalassotalea sp. M1531]|uniref:Phosphate ABC transporter substrate-binding protein n=1 Tax=Thalassotalea algicola TaxID=2716224 RepID=A0A7Y0LFZ1_9GAMM|nr:hypothetical protein [Thalassotalea algicola]NMP33554.1 hypothetical protein [Thalassotalea algicola]